MGPQKHVNDRRKVNRGTLADPSSDIGKYHCNVWRQSGDNLGLHSAL